MTKQKANIYVDCAGNVETDVYLKESDIPKLKEFLASVGYEVDFVGKHNLSCEKGKPFIQNKPRVAKRIVHEVDWYNPDVITLLLNSQKSRDMLLKEIIAKSGKVSAEESKATEFTIIARYEHIAREYEKWKRENKVTETNENRSKLHSDFAKYYIDLIKKRKQKRLQPGTKVYIIPKDAEGIIKAYKEDKGSYDVEFEDGFSGYFERKDLEEE